MRNEEQKRRIKPEENKSHGPMKSKEGEDAGYFFLLPPENRSPPKPKFNLLSLLSYDWRPKNVSRERETRRKPKRFVDRPREVEAKFFAISSGVVSGKYGEEEEREMKEIMTRVNSVERLEKKKNVKRQAGYGDQWRGRFWLVSYLYI